MGRKRRSRDRAGGEAADVRAEVPVDRPPRRRRKWRRRLIVLLVLVVGLIAAAPTIIGRTVLRNTLLAQAMPAGWTIDSQQASFGWAASQTVLGLTITDPAGEPLLTVESLTVPRSLLSLAIDQADLGTIKLVRPTAYVETRADGSNWEDFVAALNSLEQQQSDASVQLTVEVVEGVVRGTDVVTGRQWLIDDANIAASVGESIAASGSAEVAVAESTQRGKLKFQLQPGEAGAQQMEVLAARVPLTPLQPYLDRFAPGTLLAGVVSTDARATWQNDPQRGLTVQTSGRLEASNLDVATPALAGDRLRSRRVTAPWDIKLVGDEIEITQLTVDADWAKMFAAGKLSLQQLQTINLDEVLRGQLPKREVKLGGEVNLATLAAMLPSTLQLREGVRVDAGRLKFDAGGASENGRFAWRASAEIDQVAGTDGRRQIRWDQPTNAEVLLRETANGAQLETVQLDAPFAQAELRTEQAAVRGDVQVDLANLSRELGQFVDLQRWQLRGLGEGQFSIAREANNQFRATANLQLTDLRVADGDREVWTEPKLAVELNANGTEQNLQPVALAAGKLQVRGPRDQLSATLAEPMPLDGSRPARWQVEGNGPLELWADRLRPWLPSVPRQLAGETHLSAQVQLAGDSLQIVRSEGSIGQLRVQTDALSIEEPRVEFNGDAAVDLRTGSLRTGEVQLLSQSFTLRARNVDVAVAGGAPTARGTVAFRADMERLATMAKLTGDPQSTWPQGTAVGQVQLASDADRLQAELNMQLDKLQLVRATAAAGATYGPPEVVWSEPQLNITGAVKYAIATDRVQLDNLQVRGQTLQLSTNATVERATADATLQANGLVEYAPEQLAQLVSSYAGREVQLQGDRQVRFQVAGPLAAGATHWSHSWDIAAEAGWSSAGVYGLPLGGGKLSGSLRNGQLQIAPLDIAVGEGRFTAAPSVRLTPGAQQLVLPQGPLVTDVAISPEVSETMLKYVAPILAGATRAEGKFSIDLDQAEVPFGQPERSRVQGHLMTHRLSVSPGPMMNQLIALVKQVEALSKGRQFLQAATRPSNKSFLTMTEQQVDFQVVEGRVYHRNLEFLIDDAPVRSYGSVGFDQTLALVIEVPIQDKWIESEPALRGFAGQSLKLPIYGSFDKPRIDERAVADLSRQLLQGAATQAIGDELNRQFEKLFR